MTTIKFKNGDRYPSYTHRLPISLTGKDVEIVITISGSEFHRDEATVIDGPDGVVGYDLDGVKQFDAATYTLSYDVDGALYPQSEDIFLEVTEGSRDHEQDDGSVIRKPNKEFNEVDANVVRSGYTKTDSLDTARVSIDSPQLTIRGHNGETSRQMDATAANLNQAIEALPTSGGAIDVPANITLDFADSDLDLNPDGGAIESQAPLIIRAVGRGRHSANPDSASTILKFTSGQITLSTEKHNTRIEGFDIVGDGLDSANEQPLFDARQLRDSTVSNCGISEHPEGMRIGFSFGVLTEECEFRDLGMGVRNDPDDGGFFNNMAFVACKWRYCGSEVGEYAVHFDDIGSGGTQAASFHGCLWDSNNYGSLKSLTSRSVISLFGGRMERSNQAGGQWGMWTGGKTLMSGGTYTPSNNATDAAWLAEGQETVIGSELYAGTDLTTVVRNRAGVFECINSTVSDDLINDSTGARAGTSTPPKAILDGCTPGNIINNELPKHVAYRPGNKAVWDSISIDRIANNTGLELPDIVGSYSGDFKLTREGEEMLRLAAGAVKTPQGLTLDGNGLEGIATYDNASPSTLSPTEIAIDTNRGGTGTLAILYRASDGTTHYFDVSGQL